MWFDIVGILKENEVIINAYTSTTTNQKQFGKARPSSFTVSSVWFHASQPLNCLYKDINNCIRAGIFKHRVLSDTYFFV
jgi:hypothetical protein